MYATILNSIFGYGLNLAGIPRDLYGRDFTMEQGGAAAETPQGDFNKISKSKEI